MAGQKQLVRWVMLAAVIGGCAGLVSPALAQAQAVVAKQCDHCKRIVPVTAQVGQNCPYCGAYWGAEQSVSGGDGGYPSSGNSGYSSPGYVPRPRNFLEQMALYQALVQQQMLQRQMLQDQMRQQAQEAARQRMAECCEAQREKAAALRAKVYEQNREKTALAKQNANPQAQAARYVATAAQCEKEGNVQRAVILYQMALRSAPRTPPAAEATEALARLSAE